MSPGGCDCEAAHQAAVQGCARRSVRYSHRSHQVPASARALCVHCCQWATIYAAVAGPSRATAAISGAHKHSTL